MKNNAKQTLNGVLKIVIKEGDYDSLLNFFPLLVSPYFLNLIKKTLLNFNIKI